jgi:phage terminase small subunit
MPPSKKQESFAIAYIQTGNATEAYRRAYNTQNMSQKTINEAASRLLRNSKVAARISDLRGPALAAADITIERTLREVARIAYADPRRLFNPDGSMKAVGDMDEDTRALIASVETTEEQGSTGEDGQAGPTIRTRKVKLWDKNSALEKLLKHLGLYEKGNAQARENLSIQVVFVDPPKRPPDPMELEVERRDR